MLHVNMNYQINAALVHQCEWGPTTLCSVIQGCPVSYQRKLRDDSGRARNERLDAALLCSHVKHGGDDDGSS